MKTLTEIKNNYAKEQGFENWHEIKKAFRNKEINFLKFERYENKLFELIQIEQQKLIAENARLQVKLAIKIEPQIFNKYGNDDGFIEVNRESIINENNIIR